MILSFLQVGLPGWMFVSFVVFQTVIPSQRGDHISEVHESVTAQASLFVCAVFQTCVSRPAQGSHFRNSCNLDRPSEFAFSVLLFKSVTPTKRRDHISEVHALGDLQRCVSQPACASICASWQKVNFFKIYVRSNAFQCNLLLAHNQ